MVLLANADEALGPEAAAPSPLLESEAPEPSALHAPAPAPSPGMQPPEAVRRVVKCHSAMPDGQNASLTALADLQAVRHLLESSLDWADALHGSEPGAGQVSMADRMQL